MKHSDSDKDWSMCAATHLQEKHLSGVQVRSPVMLPPADLAALVEEWRNTWAQPEEAQRWLAHHQALLPGWAWSSVWLLCFITLERLCSGPLLQNTTLPSHVTHVSRSTFLKGLNISTYDELEQRTQTLLALLHATRPSLLPDKAWPDQWYEATVARLSTWRTSAIPLMHPSFWLEGSSFAAILKRSLSSWAQERKSARGYDLAAHSTRPSLQLRFLLHGITEKTAGAEEYHAIHKELLHQSWQAFTDLQKDLKGLPLSDVVFSWTESLTCIHRQVQGLLENLFLRGEASTLPWLLPTCTHLGIQGSPDVQTLYQSIEDKKVCLSSPDLSWLFNPWLPFDEEREALWLLLKEGLARVLRLAEHTELTALCSPLSHAEQTSKRRRV